MTSIKNWRRFVKNDWRRGNTKEWQRDEKILFELDVKKNEKKERSK